MRPMMHDENVKLKLLFARKVYSILTFQLLLTIVVISVLIFVPPVVNFCINYSNVLFVVGVFAFIPVECCQYLKHPLGYFFLLILTVSLALLFGPLCTLASGKILLKAVILTTGVVMSRSLYTFWTTKRSRNFSYLGILLNESIFVVILLILIKILFPSGNLLTMIYGWLASITFYGYILYNTENLIKEFTYAKYITASISLYLEVITIFFCVLAIFGVAEFIKKNVGLLIEVMNN